METITNYDSEFVAIGKAGFRGYIIFGFPEKNVFVLESVFPNNATYIFDKDWEDLSKMTKAQILSKNLQKDRIIHREGWHKKIRDLLE